MRRPSLRPSPPSRFVVYCAGKTPSLEQVRAVRALAGLNVVAESINTFLVDAPASHSALLQLLSACPGWTACPEAFYGICETPEEVDAPKGDL